MERKQPRDYPPPPPPQRTPWPVVIGLILGLGLMISAGLGLTISALWGTP